MRHRALIDDRDEWLRRRTEVVTSTEVSALFGLNPYETHYALWHRKQSGDLGEIKQTERMTWGLRLEEAIAKGVGEERGTKVRKIRHFYWLDPDRLGASYDYELVGEATILEIKKVDSLIYRNHWIEADDHSIQDAPPHIELQVQAQMLCMGRQKALIAALVGGNTLRLGLREADPETQRALLAKVHEFWASIEANQPPPPNYSIDSKTIIAMLRASTAGKFVDLSDDEPFSVMARQYSALGKQATAINTERDALKAQLLERMTDAEAVAFDGGRISAKQIGEADIAYRRKGYRDFRITVKAKKPEEIEA